MIGRIVSQIMWLLFSCNQHSLALKQTINILLKIWMDNICIMLLKVCWLKWMFDSSLNFSFDCLMKTWIENDCCTRNCLGEIRSFVMRLYDNQRKEIIRFERPIRCNSCLFPCFLQVCWRIFLKCNSIYEMFDDRN